MSHRKGAGPAQRDDAGEAQRVGTDWKPLPLSLNQDSTQPERIDYSRLAEMSEELDRPIGDLLAQGYDSDPFYAGLPSRRAPAEWFAEIWKRFGFRAGVHVRRIHYTLISQKTPVLDHRGSPYENTVNCWTDLKTASRDARLLGLVPIEAFEDHRADDPVLNVSNEAEAADLSIDGEDEKPIAAPSFPSIRNWLPALPEYEFSPAVVDQRYHVEVWVEKSTVNDVLEPLCRSYGINLVTGVGDLSLTRCHELVERAVEIGRPVRILYVADFDPNGHKMPVGVARKIEFLIHKLDLDLDVQVRPVALTHAQCRRYRLPRAPMKESNRGKAAFEERFGEGATELDALEALRPGELRRILTREIKRYHDAGLDESVEETADAFKEQLRELRQEIIAPHAEELDGLRDEQFTLAQQCDAELRPIVERYEEAFSEIAEGTIATEMRDRMPDIDEIDWPDPEDGDEDEDPLFDSTRDYVEQIDRFRKHLDNSATKDAPERKRRSIATSRGWRQRRKNRA